MELESHAARTVVVAIVTVVVVYIEAGKGRGNIDKFIMNTLFKPSCVSPVSTFWFISHGRTEPKYPTLIYVI
jgi:hypothetical protein